MKLEKLIKRFRIDDPDHFRLASFDPGDTGGLDLDKDEAKAVLAGDFDRLSELQERLYADDHWALLIVLQAMDAAGKDGVIKHVMTGINPQGCLVHPFKAPSAERARPRFPLAGGAASAGARRYRHLQPLPLRGGAGGARASGVSGAPAHPQELVGKDIWKERFKSIRAFERHLARNGTIVLKFFLHVSREEQRHRFLARLEQPAQALEVLDGRRRRAQALGQIHGRLRGYDSFNQPPACPVVRGARPTISRSRDWWWQRR